MKIPRAQVVPAMPFLIFRRIRRARLLEVCRISARQFDVRKTRVHYRSYHNRGYEELNQRNVCAQILKAEPGATDNALYRVLSVFNLASTACQIYNVGRRNHANPYSKLLIRQWH